MQQHNLLIYLFGIYASIHIVKKSGRPNWRPLWWVGDLRFSPNWIKFEKPSENRVSLTIFVLFWQFFTVSSILAESQHSNSWEWTSVWLSEFFDTPGTPGGASTNFGHLDLCAIANGNSRVIGLKLPNWPNFMPVRYACRYPRSQTGLLQS